MLAISDFTAAALPPEISLRYWGAQLPVRLAFFFALTAFSYVLTPSSTLSSRVAATDHLKNRLVFSAGFMELALWYYVSEFPTASLP